MKLKFTCFIFLSLFTNILMAQTSNTWVSGSSSGAQKGIYGTKGVGSTSNIPGARNNSISWTQNDTLWLFGGSGYDRDGNFGPLNDLWKYNKVNGQWTWVSGGDTVNQISTYNSPGARSNAFCWTGNGTLWLYGGLGYDGNGDYGRLNDLWCYYISSGLWIKYRGSFANDYFWSSMINNPGPRSDGVSWTANGKFWLFGGNGYDENGNGTSGRLNDLWEYDPSYDLWTLRNGNREVNQSGTYGTQGVGSSFNIPGARSGSISWTDEDTLWLFGGFGYDKDGNSGNLNDLWKCSKIYGTWIWTWINGSNTKNQKGTSGTRGTGSTSNIPGARNGAISWIVDDTLWLFGGSGYDAGGNSGYLNDLWKYNKINGQWTLMSGSNTGHQIGTYGTQGVGSTSNIPGSRSNSISWTLNDTLWLFGGYGINNILGNNVFQPRSFNDLWSISLICSPANITHESSNSLLCEGGDTLFGLSATGTIFGHQWQRNTGGGWSNLSGENNDTVYLSSVSYSMDGYQYRCVVSTVCGNDTSSARTLTVRPQTQITTEPIHDTLCDGGSSFFSAVVAGHNLNYVWQTDSGDGSGSLKNLLLNNDTLITSNVPLSSNNWLYRLLVQGTCGNDTSSLHTLTVRSNPNITGITSSLNPSYNGYAPMQCSNLTATTTGGLAPYTYTWSPSGSGNPLNVCPTTGTWFTATVTDANGCQDTMSIKQYVIDASSTYAGRVTMCIKNPRGRFTTTPVILSAVPYYLSLPGNSLGACGALPSKQGDAGYDDFADWYNIYPNPFANELNIEFMQMFEEEVGLSLTDLTGRVLKEIYQGKLYEGELVHFTLDASDLGSGMYLIRYESDTDMRVNKVQLVR